MGGAGIGRTYAGAVHLSLVAVVVAEYDPAIEYFVDVLGFELVEDSPALTTAGGRPKRWVVVRPPGAVTGLLLARADGAEQAAAVGQQVAGRVGFFLHVEDFGESYERMSKAGVEFVTEPRDEPYGRVVVFRDIAGNKWDMIGPALSRCPWAAAASSKVPSSPLTASCTYGRPLVKKIFPPVDIATGYPQGEDPAWLSGDAAPQAGRMTNNRIAGDHAPRDTSTQPAAGSAATPGAARPGIRERVVRVGSPASLLALVPQLMGFEPRMSIVVIGVRAAAQAGPANPSLRPARRVRSRDRRRDRPPPAERPDCSATQGWRRGRVRPGIPCYPGRRRAARGGGASRLAAGRVPPGAQPALLVLPVHRPSLLPAEGMPFDVPAIR